MVASNPSQGSGVVQQIPVMMTRMERAAATWALALPRSSPDGCCSCGATHEPCSLHSAALRSDRSSGATLTESRVVCQLLELVGGGLYPVYPHDGDQVPFDLVQHPVRADAQPAVGAADERARRRRIVS